MAHLGRLEKSKVPRRTSAEVQQECEAKAKAKEDCEKVKKKKVLLELPNLNTLIWLMKTCLTRRHVPHSLQTLATP